MYSYEVTAKLGVPAPLLPVFTPKYPVNNFEDSKVNIYIHKSGKLINVGN